jgi:hypothetical protein
MEIVLKKKKKKTHVNSNPKKQTNKQHQPSPVPHPRELRHGSLVLLVVLDEGGEARMQAVHADVPRDGLLLGVQHRDTVLKIGALLTRLRLEVEVVVNQFVQTALIVDLKKISL